MNERWIDEWMSKQMSKQIDKQIDKQMNNKRLVLKKGQIAILEALYGGRFGGCWLFWFGVRYLLTQLMLD